jgi:hypothetical protein
MGVGARFELIGQSTSPTCEPGGGGSSMYLRNVENSRTRIANADWRNRCESVGPLTDIRRLCSEKSQYSRKLTSVGTKLAFLL